MIRRTWIVFLDTTFLVLSIGLGFRIVGCGAGAKNVVLVELSHKKPIHDISLFPFLFFLFAVYLDRTITYESDFFFLAIGKKDKSVPQTQQLLANGWQYPLHCVKFRVSQ